MAWFQLLPKLGFEDLLPTVWFQLPPKLVEELIWSLSLSMLWELHTLSTELFPRTWPMSTAFLTVWLYETTIVWVLEYFHVLTSLVLSWYWWCESGVTSTYILLLLTVKHCETYHVESQHFITWTCQSSCITGNTQEESLSRWCNSIITHVLHAPSTGTCSRQYTWVMESQVNESVAESLCDALRQDWSWIILVHSPQSTPAPDREMWGRGNIWSASHYMLYHSVIQSSISLTTCWFWW